MLEIVPMTLKEANAFVEQNNNYPRRLLGWKSANDLFQEQMRAA